MAKKILQIIEDAYRCTIEEQDDPVVWLITAMQGHGGTQSHVLLRGNAVNYAVKGQDASGLTFGTKKQTRPPRLDKDVVRMVEKGIDVYVVEDDAGERGLERSDFVPGVKTVSRSGVAALAANYDFVWHW